MIPSFPIRRLGPARFLLATVLAVVVEAEEAHDPSFRADVRTEAKPWTHLRFRNDPGDFQFAIVGDNTGGWRPGVFDDAVDKLNRLQPEFVINVGDCTKGNSLNAETNAQEWDEFTAMTARLEMPFFIVAGNHDLQMKWLPGRVQPEQMMEQWQARFGPTYYSFVYKNVLFVVLFSNDGMTARREQFVSEEQAAYFEDTMRAHPDVRRTFVLLHHPLWAYPHESNFSRIEAALAGRPHTVIAGHQHRYMYVKRNQADYYVLATTGGSSPLRGPAFGEFDHVTWVTMRDDGPRLANLKLDGILPHDVFTPGQAVATRALEESAGIEATLLIDGENPVRGGSAFLALRNASDRTLRLEGEFRQHPQIHPQPGRVERTLAPRTQEVVEVALKVVEPLVAAGGTPLEFSGEVRPFDEPAAPGLRLPVRATMPLETFVSGLWGTTYREFAGSTTVEPRYARDDREIRFTADGSDPTRESPVFDRPYTFAKTTTLKARLFTRGGLGGPVDEFRLEKIPAGRGLLCHYYEHDASEGNLRAMPSFDSVPPTSTRRVANFDPGKAAPRADNFALVFHGWLAIEEDGDHVFHLASTDGARLLVGGETVVDDAIKHPRREVSGTVCLTRGRHAVEVHYFRAKRTDGMLAVEFTPPSGGRRAIPDARLSFDDSSAPTLKAPVAAYSLD